MIVIDQYPHEPFDQTYGPNPVTVTGIPVDPITGVPTADKYVLQVWVNGTLVADLRQSPNRNAKAIFDIQNTLQNYVSPSKNNIEETGYFGNELANSSLETVSYVIRASYEQSGVVPQYPGDPGEWDETPPLINFAGKKEYFEVPYNANRYVPNLNTFTGCTTVSDIAQPFTDRFTGRRAIDIFNSGDGIPPFLSASTVNVIEQDVTVDDMTTTSFFNGVRGTGPSNSKGIEAFVFYQYNGPVLLSTDIVYNQQAFGGGPNTSTGQGLNINYPYNGITAATGPKNFQDFAGSNCTHYYVIACPWTATGCITDFNNIARASMFNPMRFNIIDNNCNDFPSFQFSWLNSFGYRDYFSFKKRKDRRVAIKRNNYLSEAADYGGSSYDVDIYDRGTVTYSQSLQENYTAFTDYISDTDAIFLESLFTSPDVKVRFDEKGGAGKYQWVPVTLLSADYEQKTVRKNKLFQYEIKFKRAHNLKSQRG